MLSTHMPVRIQNDPCPLGGRAVWFVVLFGCFTFVVWIGMFVVRFLVAVWLSCLLFCFLISLAHLFLMFLVFLAWVGLVRYRISVLIRNSSQQVFVRGSGSVMCEDLARLARGMPCHCHSESRIIIVCHNRRQQNGFITLGADIHFQ